MQLKDRLKQNIEFIWINSFLIVFFSIIAFYSPWKAVDELLLLTPDSQTYFETGKEFLSSNYEGSSIIRPFLYSELLYIFHSIGGAVFVVIAQFLCWILSANLIYITLKRCGLQKVFALLGLVLFALNLSLILYVFHGLTEIFATFLLSVLAFQILYTKEKKLTTSSLLKIVFVVSLLTVTKPLFYYPWLLFILISLAHFILNKVKIGRTYLSFLLALSPVIFQISYMKVKHNVLKVSTIDTITFNDYLFAQGIREVEHIEDIEESREIARSFTSQEKREFLWKNKGVYFKCYRDNLWTNIDTDESNFLMSPSENAKKYSNFMDYYNKYLYLISRIMLIAFMLFFLFDLIKKRVLLNWRIYAVGLFLYYLAFSSGISFWQADRLVIFTIPLWICLYFILADRFNKQLIQKAIKKTH